MRPPFQSLLFIVRVSSVHACYTICTTSSPAHASIYSTPGLLHRPPRSFLPSPLGARRVSLLLSRIEVALDALQHGLRGSLGSQASLHRRLRTQLAYLSVCILGTNIGSGPNGGMRLMPLTLSLFVRYPPPPGSPKPKPQDDMSDSTQGESRHHQPKGAAAKAVGRSLVLDRGQ
ncbi:hypothetical protein LY78DRAFT_298339 [Colletotrichum sublineola]|nr:hypothetical protein LY78DRAFT_298339 [Colletotrichum sublineola]